MDKGLLNGFEETLAVIKGSFSMCSGAMDEVKAAIDSDKLLFNDKIDQAILSLNQLRDYISSCCVTYRALTGEDLRCESYSDAIVELERLKTRLMFETAEEFLAFDTTDESLVKPLEDAKEMLSVILEGSDHESVSEEDAATLSSYATFVESYRLVGRLTSKERFNLMKSLSDLFGEDLVIGAFMDYSLVDTAAEALSAELSAAGAGEGAGAKAEEEAVAEAIAEAVAEAEKEAVAEAVAEAEKEAIAEAAAEAEKEAIAEAVAEAEKEVIAEAVAEAVAEAIENKNAGGELSKGESIIIEIKDEEDGETGDEFEEEFTFDEDDDDDSDDEDPADEEFFFEE